MDSFEEWREKVGELRPRCLPSGEEVEALYREAAHAAAFLPPRQATKLVMEYDHWNLDTVRAQIARELTDTPCDGAWIRLDRATRLGATHSMVDAEHVGKDGTVIATASELAPWCDRTSAEVALIFDAGANALPIAALLRAARKDHAHQDESEQFMVISDPLYAWARDGYLPASLNDCFREGREATHLFGVSTLPYHDAGCSPAQEVAFAIATVIDYSRSIEDFEGVDLAVRVGVTPDIFSEVAKLRALHAIWWRLMPELGERGFGVNAVASTRTFSTREPWVNQLRSTACGLAAQIGGAHTFCPRAYDAAAPGSTELGRRVARNTAIMLTEEAHVGRVADAAAGAGLIEALTDKLARDAWALVQSIEGQGGMAAALASGWLRTRIDEEWAKLCERYQDGGVLVGVNEFSTDAVLAGSKDVVDVDAIAARFGELRDDLELRSAAEVISAAEAGASMDDLSMGLVRGTVAGIEPMPVRRIAAELGWEGKAS